MIVAPSAVRVHVVVDGRKGACDVATQWRTRDRCPSHHDEQCGQDEGTGSTQGPLSRTISATATPAPPNRPEPLAVLMPRCLVEGGEEPEAGSPGGKPPPRNLNVSWLPVWLPKI
jgi:hypothetical protein